VASKVWKKLKRGGATLNSVDLCPAASVISAEVVCPQLTTPLTNPGSNTHMEETKARAVALDVSSVGERQSLTPHGVTMASLMMMMNRYLLVEAAPVRVRVGDGQHRMKCPMWRAALRVMLINVSDLWKPFGIANGLWKRGWTRGLKSKVPRQ
jgi:hypothetical protein